MSDHHLVGIRRVASRGMLPPIAWRAVCDECGWEGEPHAAEARGKTWDSRSAVARAQAEALEHQGGTRRVRERNLGLDTKREPRGMDEMFPEAGRSA